MKDMADPFWDEAYRSRDYLQHWEYSHPSQELVAAVACGLAPKEATALDIGCGAGRASYRRNVMRRIDLESLPWVQAAAGVLFKSAEQAGRRVRLVEFAPAFSEAEWCRRAHVGYVLEGRLEIQFAEAAEMFSAGDALIIGAEETHRARVIEGPVRLFLVEDT